MGRSLTVPRLVPLLAVLALALALGGGAAGAPTSVTLAGSLQSELGCSGDWQPDCATTDLTPTDGVFYGTFTIPAGSYEYKAALNHTWVESYGWHGGGDNIPLAATGGPIQFAFDPVSHWVADSVNSKLVTAPGSFQSELGCPGDWQPDCLRSWLEDLDGDGIFTFETRSIPIGTYDAKVTIGRKLGRELRRGRRAQRPEHHVLRHGDQPARPLHLQLDDARHDDPGGPRERQQRRVGRPRLRLAREPLQGAAGRGAGRNAGEGPLPHLPQTTSPV